MAQADSGAGSPKHPATVQHAPQVDALSTLLTFRQPEPAAPAPVAPAAEPAARSLPAPLPPGNQMVLPAIDPSSAAYRLQHMVMPEQAAAQKAQAARDLHARAIREQQGPTLNTPRHPQGVGVGHVDPMTTAEYQALTDQQRAAVDFNTMLVQAVRQDLRNQDNYDPTETQQATYDATLEKMFGGGDPASHTYAPATTALLKQIGYHDPASKLDDFLHLNAAITAKDMRQSLSAPVLARPVTAPAPTDAAGVRTDLVQTLAASTQRLEETLAKGNALLASLTQNALADRASSVDLLGGIARQPNTGLGYDAAVYTDTGAPADLNTYYQDAFTKLADKSLSGQRDQILAAMGQALSPAEMDGFLSYADQRAYNAERFGVPLGTGDGVKYLTPEEFRKQLGMGE